MGGITPDGILTSEGVSACIKASSKPFHLHSQSFFAYNKVIITLICLSFLENFLHTFKVCSRPRTLAHSTPLVLSLLRQES